MGCCGGGAETVTLDAYQEISNLTAIYPNKGSNMSYPALGLCGEAGEIANKVKKIYRDHDGVLTQEYREILSAELGDVLWYVAAIASELDVSLGEIALSNVDKLADRQARNKLGGDGDKR